MATAREWIAGSRPRTLPAAIAPVAVGTGVAAHEHAFSAPRALLALTVALALQVGVNFANDYSDGVRGTDAVRVGPVRLVGQRLAPPGAVLAAAVASFGLAAIAGLALIAVSGAWWLLAVGAAAIASAWFYTGGRRPYGYAGLGEVFVFVFFGVVAVVGTAYTQTGTLSALALIASIPPGLWACAILLANNLRDIPGDREVGKMTLAVRLGDRRTRRVYLALVGLGFVAIAALAMFSLPALIGLLALPLAVKPVSVVASGASGPALIPVLSGTGAVLLAGGLLVAVGLSV
ncbi:MAG: 1,4-dihydroxy-2-naphthoate polyprenyltransferase [Candidatus Nanopelagicales bacterium]|nr:1,4-dihydroxy-2-naphthoate polyprenyltransferase [Candidatus Nanopelagicales bacterium]